MFEGNYYGEFDNYRPKFLTIMEVNTDQYGEVNVEGFAIGSIQNQGFVYGDDVGFTTTLMEQEPVLILILMLNMIHQNYA